MTIFGNRVFKEVIRASLIAQLVNHLLAVQETWVRFLGWEDPWRGNGNPPQYSCLESPMDRGDWQEQSRDLKSWT